MQICNTFSAKKVYWVYIESFFSPSVKLRTDEITQKTECVADLYFNQDCDQKVDADI